MGDRCKRCDKPVATEADWEATPEGEGEHLCWGFCSPSCVAVDWRARALAAETSLDELRSRVNAVTQERDRLQRACDEGLPREVIHCPVCGTTHVEGPRHDDPTKDGRVRPNHTHRCYDCEHVWDDGRWTFGVAPGGENEVTKRLRAEGVRLALVAVQARNREAYEMHRKGADEVSGTLAAWTDEMVREIRDLLPESKAATDEHNAAVLRARDEGRAAGLREALALVDSYQRSLALVDSYQPPSVPTEPTELDNVVSMIGTVLRATKGGGA